MNLQKPASFNEGRAQGGSNARTSVTTLTCKHWITCCTVYMCSFVLMVVATVAEIISLMSLHCSNLHVQIQEITVCQWSGTMTVHG